MKKNRVCGLVLSCLLAGTASGFSQSSTGHLKGMLQEMVVKPAKDLKVKAPSGDYVAVLDQNGPSQVKGASPSQDHHNGWLELVVFEIEGDAVKVKGKYYIPAENSVVPDGMRLTLRQRSPEGLIVMADQTLNMKGAETGKWVDFEITLPANKSTKTAVGKVCLLLSAVPLAGPLYLDNLEVTDPQGNQLWQFPEFEGL